MQDTPKNVFALFTYPDKFERRKPDFQRAKPPAWVRDRMARTIFRSAFLTNYRTAHLYWNCGWSKRAIADELGVSEEAVAQTIRRLQKLEG